MVYICSRIDNEISMLNLVSTNNDIFAKVTSQKYGRLYDAYRFPQAKVNGGHFVLPNMRGDF